MGDFVFGCFFVVFFVVFFVPFVEVFFVVVLDLLKRFRGLYAFLVTCEFSVSVDAADVVSLSNLTDFNDKSDFGDFVDFPGVVVGLVAVTCTNCFGLSCTVFLDDCCRVIGRGRDGLRVFVVFTVGVGDVS